MQGMFFSSGSKMRSIRASLLLEDISISLRQLAACTQIPPECQAEDPNIAEPCIKILEQIRWLFDTVLTAKPRDQAKISWFMMEQISLIYQVLSSTSQEAHVLCPYVDGPIARQVRPLLSQTRSQYSVLALPVTAE